MRLHPGYLHKQIERKEYPKRVPRAPTSQEGKQPDHPEAPKTLRVLELQNNGLLQQQTKRFPSADPEARPDSLTEARLHRNLLLPAAHTHKTA